MITYLKGTKMKKMLLISLLVGMLISASGCNSNIGMLLSGKRTFAGFIEDARLATDPKFRRQWYVNQHPYTGQHIWLCKYHSLCKDALSSPCKNPRSRERWEKTNEHILVGSITIGMTKEQVTYSWGKPSKINRTTSRYGVREQWCYYSGSYVYFDNDGVTSIQN